eukprot:3927672-Pyramimonas_sp.AAC.1
MKWGAGAAKSCLVRGRQQSTAAVVISHLARKEIRGESNSSVVKRLSKGLTDRFHLRHFSDVREKLGGELNSSVVEWLNKGLMSTSSPIDERLPRLVHSERV